VVGDAVEVGDDLIDGGGCCSRWGLLVWKQWKERRGRTLEQSVPGTRIGEECFRN